MSLLNEKILVIGGTGFIGTHICIKAVKEGMNVTSVSLNRCKKVIDGVNYLKADITSINDLKASLKNNNFDFVVNCGGYIDHSPYFNGGQNIIQQHLDGVKNLIKVIDLKNIKRFIQIGSSDEYGLISAPQKEEDFCNPISPYSFAKLSSSNLLQMLGRYENYPTCILRFFLVYGPLQKENRLLPYVINNILNNKKINLSGGDQIKDYTYIDDIVDGIFSCLMVDKNINGEIINLCSSNPITIKEIVNKIVELTNTMPLDFGDKDYRPNENMELWGSNNKAKEILNWQPKIDLVNGLKKTIKSYKQ